MTKKCSDRFTFVAAFLVEIKYMNPQTLRYGVLGGILVVAINIALNFYDTKFMLNNSSYFGYVAYLLVLFLATKKHRENLGGAMTIKQGFIQAWQVFVVASLFEAIFIYILWNFVNPELPSLYKDLVVENARWYCEMAEINPCLQLQDAEKMRPNDFKITLFGMVANYFGRLLAPGAIFSFLAGLICRREEI